MRRVSELKKHPTNPRRISHRKRQELKVSIQRDPEFFFYDPLLIDDEDIVWSGNQRIDILKELRIDEVATIDISELPEEKRKRLMYQKNHHAGEDDADLLLEIFTEDELVMMGHELKKSAFERELEGIDDEAAEYPLVPIFDEKYGCVLIIYKTEGEKANLETLLNLESQRAYNKKHIQTSYVMTAEQFVQKWNER